MINKKAKKGFGIGKLLLILILIYLAIGLFVYFTSAASCRNLGYSLVFGPLQFFSSGINGSVRGCAPVFGW